MALFQYTARDPQGNEVKDTIEAADETQAREAIKQAGYFPRNITLLQADEIKAPKKGFSLSFMGSGVSSKILTVFTRQLATLIDAGLPILRGLRTLEKQEKNQPLREAINKMIEAVEGGSTFSEAMSQHGKIFNKLYVNMVKAGELGGVLETVLNRLAEFQEKAQRIKGKITSAMFYPIAVLVIAVGIVAFLLAFIVPKFQEIFKDMLGDKPLPALTQFVIGASEALKNNFLIIAGVGVIFFVGFKFFANTPFGIQFLDRLKLNVPALGVLIRLTAISRFSRTLGTLVNSGVPILQALNITKETAGNFIIAEAIEKVHDAVREGESIVTPLDASGVFPPMVVSMVEIGEETGRLPDMLIKIADVYEDEVDNAVAGLTSLLEPIMIVFLALVVGTIVIALFLPLISIITEMSNQTS